MIGTQPLVIFSGNSNRTLAKRICKYLGVPLGKADIQKFPDGEVSAKIEADVRGADVFIIQPTCTPVNDHLMELLILVDALKRASSARITAVIPYFGYARQDRKDEGRVPITAKLVANLIETAGVDRVVTLDLHAAQIQGFFDIPVDHLYGSRVIARYLKRLDLSDLVVTSPDVGGLKMAWAYAKLLDARLAVVEKRRISPDSVEVGFVIGDVSGRNVVIVDDLISTGGTVSQAAHLLKEKGAERVIIAATHAVFCGPAIERLTAAPVEEIIVTDTIPVTANLPNLQVLSVADFLGEAMHRIHMNKSVSKLFRS
ncbi:MAG: ribose-phosphate pyrophosphokinase [Planctomycetota bacterium]|nr:ribose-phosphate pyrophosphokinase [Planctomycetota bacterium]